MRVAFAFTALIGCLASLPLAAYGGLLWLGANGTDAEALAGELMLFGGPLVFVGSVWALVSMLRVRQR